MRRLMISLVTIIAGTYILLGALLYLFQPRFVYFPSKQLDATPAVRNLPFEDVRFAASDGVQLHGWFVNHPNARGVVLFFHGNAGNISHRLETLELFYQLGLSTLIIDYRGYGESEGRPSEAGTYADAAGAYNYLLHERSTSADKIVVFGRSLGAAIATWLAAERDVGGLALEAGFSSMGAMAKHYYPYFPSSLLVRIRYPNIERIPTVNCPVLIAHSRDDEIVPYAHGRALYERAVAPKQFFELRGGHNNAFLVTGADYVSILDRFFGEVLS